MQGSNLQSASFRPSSDPEQEALSFLGGYAFDFGFLSCTSTRCGVPDNGVGPSMTGWGLRDVESPRFGSKLSCRGICFGRSSGGRLLSSRPIGAQVLGFSKL